MELDNQHAYWDQVADSKQFTHPLDVTLLRQYTAPDDLVLDYGCGYGRSLGALHAVGYTRLLGIDTSAALIARGKRQYLALASSLHHLADSTALPVPDGSVAAVLLVAVLTCIPSNTGQRALLARLHAALKPGGVLFISDYYLQADRLAAGTYICLHNDPANDGVFTLAEGATLRHHSPAWIQELTADFTLLHKALVPVHTMNGNRSEAFQLLLQKDF